MAQVLILIRHAVTLWNSARVLQGHTDIPLSPMGLWQADQLAERMTTEAPPVVICTSDLSRARQTADAIQRTCPAPLSVRSGLRERNFGIYEGRPFEETRAVLLESATQDGVDPYHFRPENGESPSDVEARVLPTMSAILSEHPEGHIWVVLHGGVLRMLLRHYIPGQAGDLEHGYQVHNTSINVLEREDSGRWMGRWINDGRHLEKDIPDSVLRAEEAAAKAVGTAAYHS